MVVSWLLCKTYDFYGRKKMHMSNRAWKVPLYFILLPNPPHSYVLMGFKQFSIPFKML